MNKKEIAEIKKQYKPEYSCIGKIAGCYVDKDKNKVLSFNISPFELPEDRKDRRKAVQYGVSVKAGSRRRDSGCVL